MAYFRCGGGTDTSDATATASDIKSGKTAYINDEKVTGSLATVQQATPSISVSSAGLITASATQTSGFVASGTKSATSQMTVNGATTWTPKTTNQTIASGTYLTGVQTIKGDANLVAGNIKKGVSIFGVAGSLIPKPSGAYISIISKVGTGMSCSLYLGSVLVASKVVPSASSVLFDGITTVGTYTAKITASGQTYSTNVAITAEMITNGTSISGTIDSKIWLYNEGDECTDLTGGWSRSNYKPNGTFEKGVNYIKLQGAASDDGVMVTGNKIKFSEYAGKQLCFLCSEVYQSGWSGYPSIYWRFVSNRNSWDGHQNSATPSPNVVYSETIGSGESDAYLSILATGSYGGAKFKAIYIE